MPTDFSEYLRSIGYADHLVHGGFKGLVTSWESIAKGLALASPAFIMYEEFLNDMDVRCILRECMELAEPDERHAIESRVAAADFQFRDNTVAVSRCIWGDDNAIKFGYTPNVDWYYFRRPKVIDDSWPVEFREPAA